MNRKMPFSTDDSVDHPVRFMQQLKKRMNSWPIPILILWLTDHRAAFLYGLWSMGTSDMALFKFTKAMLEGKSIDV